MLGCILLIYSLLCLLGHVPWILCRCNVNFMPKKFNSIGMKSRLHRSVFVAVKEKIQEVAKFRPERAGVQYFGRRPAFAAFWKVSGKR